MDKIKLRNVNNFILNNINLKVKPGEFLVLTGANGAGKTTLLNVIAGLTDYTGRVYFNGSYINGLPLHKRKIGYVFQDYYLFPHLTVCENIIYGPKVQNKFSLQKKEKLRNLIDIMNLDKLLDRYPKNLSGGEKQKVALLRAISIEPEILLMDEPLGSIDMESRDVFMKNMIKLRSLLEITVIYVTHNQQEGELLGDRVVLIKKGKISNTSFTNAETS